LQAFLQIADENINRLNAEIQVPLVIVLRGFHTGWRKWVHRRDYKWERSSMRMHREQKIM